MSSIFSKKIFLLCLTVLFISVTVAQNTEPKEYGGKLGFGFAISGGGAAAGIPLRVNFSKAFVAEAGLYIQATTITRTTYDHNFYGAVIARHMNTDVIYPLAFKGGVNFILSEKQKSSGKLVRNGIVLRAGKTLKEKFTENLVAIGWSRERFLQNEKHKSYIFELGAGVFMYGDGNSPLGWARDYEIPVMPILLFKFHWNFYVIKFNN